MPFNVYLYILCTHLNKFWFDFTDYIEARGRGADSGVRLLARAGDRAWRVGGAAEAQLRHGSGERTERGTVTVRHGVERDQGRRAAFLHWGQGQR